MGSSPSSGLAGTPRRAVVFAGGDPPPSHTLEQLSSDRDHPPFVVAADSGVEHALAAGVHVDLLIGDLDSAAPRTVLDAIAAGTEVVRHPADKDATDLELALDAVADRGYDSVLVVGIHGGRADHLLANALLLASPRYAALRVQAHLGDADVIVVRDDAELPGAAGRLCSLLPLGGDAEGVTTTGLRYPLHDETLTPGSTRGVSNVVDTAPARVALRAGVLLAVLPDGANPPCRPVIARGVVMSRPRRFPALPRLVRCAARRVRAARRVDRRDPGDARVGRDRSRDHHPRHPRLVRGVEAGTASVRARAQHQGEGARAG